MTSIFQKRASGSLPVSKSAASPASEPAAGLRRRLSLNQLKSAYPSPSGSWTEFCRSRSVSSMGEYTASSIKKWWDWGWSWVLSWKPSFAQDLEMNEAESKVLGFNSKGSLNHVLFKVRSELRKLSGSQNAGLPKACKYTPLDHTKSFNTGSRTHLVY